MLLFDVIYFDTFMHILSTFHAYFQLFMLHVADNNLNDEI